MTAHGRQLLAGEGKVVQHKRVEEEVETAAPPKRKKQRSGGENEAARPLFEELRQLRKELAKDENIPPFVIFSDATLWEMADVAPTTLQAMSSVKGVGSFKLNKYGRAFLETIADYKQHRGE